MVGKVPKADFVAAPWALRPDATARELLASLADRRDDSILAGVAGFLEEQGIRLLPQAELAPELLAGEGPLGSVRPGPAQIADIAFGWPVARAIAGLDIGQTLVVKDRAVVAVEAIEGTDAAIRRAGAIAPGTSVVKVARPHQDPRFDVPAIGPGTVAALREAKAAALAFEADCTLVLDREAMTEAADADGIALVGVRDGRLPEAPA